MTENQTYTCPNPSCGRVFANPIKAENLGSKSEVYDACPYCLTEITVEKGSKAVEEEEKPEIKSIEREQTRMYPKEELPAQQPPKVQGCTHQFGYLSKRSSKEKIPEECMMCEKIVQCMLKNITS